MIITLLIGSFSLNIIGSAVLYSLSKEKTTKNCKVVYKDKPVEKIIYRDKIVYKDKPVEKVIYKDKIVEKIIYRDKPVHEFIKKEKPKISKQKQELLDALSELKSKKKKSKKDLDNIYTIEKVIPNIK
jgi:hypothetical protein